MQGMDLSAHAYLVRSGGGAGVCLALLKERGVETAGNPDAYVRDYESLSVDDAREVAAFAFYKPINGKKYIVIGARSLTPEAQNALLKITEEGIGHSLFFFVVPRGVPLLPTLESRCVTLHTQEETHNTKEGEGFLHMTYRERLALAEKFAKDHDREGARSLVRSLLLLAGESSRSRFSGQQIRDLLDADQYLQLSGSSPKAVIGHLALIL